MAVDIREIREKVKNVISTRYDSTFKTFYINSVDGIDFVKPIGIFVSLGITTSLQHIEEIQKLLESFDFTAKIAEISSKKVDSQYLNTLVKVKDITQYECSEDMLKGKILMGEEESKKELERLKSLMTLDQDISSLTNNSVQISCLKNQIRSLTDSSGWNAHSIQKLDTGMYSIHHRYINYKNDVKSGLEYRIGIFVTD